ncbi:MAG: 4-hydroxy-tetrahydrodipicolinate synthase [Bacteroidetes bacterium]|nr:4-hydroxy-tetrahydrodipicolinate synthase [Bacteroidota bacterium]
MASLKDTLSGTGVALVTPFKKNYDVDYDGLKDMINYVINGKVEFVVALGTTAETPTLHSAEKTDIIKYTYDIVKKRVPVVVGIGGNHTYEIVHELETYPLDNAVAVLSTSPYYNKPSQEGIYQHYKALAKSSPKPILIYNVPGRSAKNVDAGTIIRLANEVENIGGIKEAGGDFAQCIKVLRDVPKDFLVVSGDDALAMPQIACGMQGVISVAANAFPREFSDMVRASLKLDFKKAKSINDKLVEAYELMFVENNPAGIKDFLTEKGLIKNYLRLPLVPLSKKYQEKIKEYLKK